MTYDSGGGGGSDQGQGSQLRPDTKFHEFGLNDLKAMLDGADPSAVEEVANGWKRVYDKLVGEDGAGGLKKTFDDAVTKVMESWHGASAEKFLGEAQKISQNFANGAPYAENSRQTLMNAAQALQSAIDNVRSIEEPGLLDRGLDYVGNSFSSGGLQGTAEMLSPAVGVTAYLTGNSAGRDDSGFNADMAAGMSTQAALEKHRGSLSEGKERALEAAVHMEALAMQYKQGTSEFKPPTIENPDNPVPPPSQSPGDVGSPGAVPTDMGQGVPNPDIPGGVGDPSYQTPVQPNSPYGPGYDPSRNGIDNPYANNGINPNQVGTGLDGVGTAGSGVGTGAGAGNLGAGAGTGTAGSGSGSSGMPGGMPGSNLGGGGAGGAGSGSGARRGMPGMGGAAGMGQQAGAGNKGRGGLARKSGGAMGAARGRSGVAGQGGSGLHRSRGGSQSGQNSGRRGMMGGAPGARGANGEERGQNGNRPDYLTEDEETWATQRNVAPRVIE